MRAGKCAHGTPAYGAVPLAFVRRDEFCLAAARRLQLHALDRRRQVRS
jgi:hypothetical protein